MPVNRFYYTDTIDTSNVSAALLKTNLEQTETVMEMS